MKGSVLRWLAIIAICVNAVPFVCGGVIGCVVICYRLEAPRERLILRDIYIHSDPEFGTSSFKHKGTLFGPPCMPEPVDGWFVDAFAVKGNHIIGTAVNRSIGTRCYYIFDCTTDRFRMDYRYVETFTDEPSFRTRLGQRGFDPKIRLHSARKWLRRSYAQP